MRSATTTTEGTGGRIRRRTALLALAAAGAIGLIGPGAAHALTLSNLKAEPAAGGSTAAGANTDFELNVAFDSEDVENIRISLPPGQIGNPTATPMCTQAQLHASTPSCPADSQVGSTAVSATVTVIALPVTLDIQGKIYNLEPNPGEAARFGIVLNPLPLDPLPPLLPVVLESAVELRQSDLGLDTVVSDIPNTTQGLPTHINEMSLTLFGNPPGGTKPFIRNPTSCDPATTVFTADGYDSDDETSGSAGYTPTACDQLDFSPEFIASVGAPGKTGPGQKPPLTTAIKQDATEAGLARAKVVLPNNVGSDPNLLTTTCPEAQFVSHTCPPGTIVGSALAESPLLTEPLSGPVAIVEGSPVPRLGLDLTGPLPLQLAGVFVLGAGTGVEFNGLPDIPISNFALTFGADALVVNPSDLCDGAARVFTTEFESHSGVAQNGTSTGTVEGCTAGGPGTPPPGKGKAKKCKKKKGKKGAAAAKKKKCKKRKKRRK